MAIAAKYKIGNTRITIMDDCAAKTSEEVKSVLKSISEFVGAVLPNGVERDEPLKFDEPIYDIGVDGNWEDKGVRLDRYLKGTYECAD